MAGLCRFNLHAALLVCLSVTAIGFAYADTESSLSSMVLIPACDVDLGLTTDTRAELARTYGLSPAVLALQQRRRVHLDPYWIDQHEVTNAEYRAFVLATSHTLPHHWCENGYPAGEDNYPVTGVNFESAQAYAQWRGKRLPTADEWERAARGTEGRLYPWGNDWKSGALGDLDAVQRFHPRAVSSIVLDKTPEEIFDLAGNVAEWVEADLPADVNYTALTCGGSVANTAPWMFLATTRNAQPKGNGVVGYIGFRCARDAEGAGTKSPGPKGIDPVAAAQRLAAITHPPVSPGWIQGENIQILPVHERNRTQVQLSPINAAEDSSYIETPWRVELRAPGLPGNRFGLLFENLYPHPEQSHSNVEHTSVTLTGSSPNTLDASIRLNGYADYVDVHFDFKNIGAGEIAVGQEMCFQALNAPDLRDHDGTRTFITTEQGLKPMMQVNTLVWPRYWLQDFWFSKPLPPGDGPHVVPGLVMIASRDNAWTISAAPISGPSIRLFNNREYSCIHANAPSALKSGDRRSVLQRIYFLKGTPAELLKRYAADRAAYNHGQKNGL